MKIIEVIAGAASAFNHPYEQYANFKPSITLKALVEDGEDPIEAGRKLQVTAQQMIDQERQRIEADLEREQNIQRAEHEVKRWESVVESYENLIATAPAKLADVSVRLDEWEHQDLARNLRKAEEGIEEARAKLGEAKAKLADLAAT